MRIGVWLDLPGAAINEGEGLLRLLSLVFMGFAQTQHDVVIVAPADARGPCEPWFDEFARLAPERFSFLTPRGGYYGAHGEREARAALARRLDVDGWLAFRLERHAVDEVPGPWVSIFADFILAEFPMHFTEATYRHLVSPAREGAAKVDRLVCFSEHVKLVHGVQFFGADAGKIEVVPHAPFDYFEFGRAGFAAAAESLGLGPINSASDLTRHACATIVRDQIRKGTGAYCDMGRRHLRPILANMAYEDLEFFLISSRNRPHKNFLTALQALESLIRETYSPLKAVTTAPLELLAEDPVSQHLIERKLHLDLLSINHLPAHVHACLYRLATVTVHPSPFEGGFPFTFAESLSMGTPIILARGPAVEGFLSAAEIEAFCFEPTSSSDLRRRIESVRANRGEYLARQLEVLERQKQRTWRDIAEAYVAVFDKARQAYWSRSDVLMRSLAASDAGSAPAPLFLGRVNGRLDAAQALFERYLPADAVGGLEIDLVFAFTPTDLSRALSLAVGAWEADGLRLWNDASVEMTCRPAGDVTVLTVRIDLPEESAGKVKELRVVWNGAARAELKRLDWRLTGG